MAEEIALVVALRVRLLYRDLLETYFLLPDHSLVFRRSDDFLGVPYIIFIAKTILYNIIPI